MFTKTLKTTTGYLKISIPKTIQELNISQVIAIQEAEDITDLKVISILSGISEEKLENIVDIRDLSQFNDRVLSLNHQISYSYNELAIPEYVVFGTKKVKILGLFYVERDNKVKVLKNLSIEPAGAYLASRDLIADEINRHIQIYGEDNWKEHFMPKLDVLATLLAHYFYCPVTGKEYSEQKAEAFKSEVLKLSVQVAMPIARHFFLKFPDLSKQKVSLWRAIRLTWNEKLALRRLRNSRS